MKTKILALTACALLGLWPGAIAQTPDESPLPPKRPPPGNPPGEQGGKMRGLMRERMLENLPPEIKQRFQAAREKALQDPKIQSLRQNADKANEEFFKAMREKMQEIDPGLAELMKKSAGHGGKGGKDRKDKDKGPGGPPGMGNLSEEERQKVMTTREKAKADPSVQAAEKKKEAAQSPEDRKKASEEYRKAMHEAMVKTDPSVAPLLEKLGPKPPPPAPPGPGGDGEMMSPES